MDKVHANGNITFTAGGAIAKGNPVKFSSGRKLRGPRKSRGPYGL